MPNKTHETPPLENSNPADMAPHAEETQLRIGAMPPEPELEAESEIPESLRLTADEEREVEKLAETHGRETAILYKVRPRSRAERIVGYMRAKRAAEHLGQSAQDRRQEEKGTHESVAELAGFMKNTYPQPERPATPDEPKAA